MTTSAVAALAAAMGACGSSSGSDGTASPATAVPAGTPVYVEATVRPEGDERVNAEALLGKVLHTADPGAKLTEGLFDDSAENGAFFNRSAGGAKVDFRRDIEPWLGDKAGAAVTRLSSRPGATTGLAVVSSRDDAKASDKLDTLLGGGTTGAKYRDVDLRTARDGKTAGAVLDGRVLLGRPADVRAAIDVLKGDRESLDSASTFTRAREANGTGGLGFFYADVRSVFRSAAADAGPGAALLGPALVDALPGTVSATLRAERDAFVVDGAAIGGPAATDAASGQGAADALAAAPADSWLALGVGDIGKSLQKTLDSVGGSGLGSIGVGEIEDQVRKATGLDLRRDVLGWMGNGAVFVEGDSIATLRGGLVVHSSDSAKSAAAVRRMGPLLRRGGSARVTALRAPGVDAGWSVRNSDGLGVLIAAAGDRFVVASGRRALQDAVGSGSRLGDAAEFRDAAGKLGDGYATSFWLNLPVIGDLVEEGAIAGDTNTARAVEALRTFGPVTAGEKRDGDISRMKLRVAVK